MQKTLEEQKFFFEYPFSVKETIDSQRSARSYKLTAVDRDFFSSNKDFVNSMEVPNSR
jgi:hypothetical protein